VARSRIGPVPPSHLIDQRAYEPPPQFIEVL